ncbi:MAG: M20 family metallopeptidase [Pseudomonadota bacterium]
MHTTIQQDQILDGIRSWIEIESPSKDRAAIGRMADRIETDYRAIGARVDRIPGRDGLGDHLLVTDDRHCPPDVRDGPGIMVLSHMDTVHPVGTLAEDLPFRIEGNAAFGPGAEDMKGGTYLALAALREIDHQSASTRRPVRHLIVSDEEIGSPTSREHIEREARRAVAVLVTEPARSGGKIVTARKGIGIYTIRAHGRSAHAGVEHELGANAIIEVARQAVQLQEMTDYEKGLTVSVGVVSGGDRTNVVPDLAEIHLEARFPDAASGDAFDAAIRALQPINPDVRLEVLGGINRPGYHKSPEIAALYEYAKGLAEEIGFDLIDLATGGGSDGNFTASIAPTLDGLGVDGDGGHTLKERLYIDSIVPRTKLLMRLMQTLG